MMCGGFILKLECDDMNNLIDAIESEARRCGTILNLREFAYYNGYYETVYIEDSDGNIVDTEKILTLKSLQEIADIFTDGFDVLNY